MASFEGFRHLDDYKGAQGFYEEVFSFATTLLHRLEPEGIVGAVHEFRIERDGGRRSLKASMVDQWGPSYFALPVQTADDRCVKKPAKGSGGSRRYRVERFAFFLVDVGTATVMVGKVTAPPDSWKGARFWDVFFRDFKKAWTEKKPDVLDSHGTQFELDLTDIPVDTPRLLNKVHKALVGYLS